MLPVLPRGPRWNPVACASLKMRRCGTSISRQLVSAYSLVLLQPFARVVQCRLVVGCRRLRLSSAAAVPRGAPVFPVRAKSLTLLHFHFTCLHTYSTSTSISMPNLGWLRLRLASALVVCRPEGIGSHVPQFPRSNLNACGPMSGLPTSMSMALQLVHTRPQLLSTSC